MASIVTQDNLARVIAEGDGELIHQAYNTLDSCVTREVWDVLERRLDTGTRHIYGFEHRCQMPAITMTLRGVLIDPTRRAAAIEHHEGEAVKAEEEVNRLAGHFWDGVERNIGRCGKHRNHLWPRGIPDTDPSKRCRRCDAPRFRPSRIGCGSSQQVQHLLFDIFKLYKRFDRRTGAPTVDAEALESLEREAFRNADERPSRSVHWRIVARCAQLILQYKKEQKQIGYVKSKLGADGRMRSSFNVGAAETGRWSASKAPDWSGWNIQQISDKIRGMIVADPGLELFYADLEQAESHVVAYTSGDQGYIDAHHSGDTHTFVCRQLLADMPWTGDMKADKALADSSFFSFDPDHSKRHYMKGVQHGVNMGRSAVGIARGLHLPLAAAEAFVEKLYGSRGVFPGIKVWQQAVWAEVQRTGIIITCFNRKRQFLGRVWDEDTLREALGQLNQSPVADVLNLALLRIWEEMDTRVNVFEAPHPSQSNRVWLLAQAHDAILGLYRPGDLETLRRVKELMTIPIQIGDRVLTIPVEIQVGPSWRKEEMRKVQL